MKIILKQQLIIALLALAASVPAMAETNSGSGEMKWIAFPDARLEVRGLPWLGENRPDLWRLPGSAKAKVPKAVWNRAVAPDGGRIRLTSSSTRLAIRAQTLEEHKKACFFDAYANGQYAGSATTVGTQKLDLVLFEKRDHALKDITIYLPHGHEVRVFGVGVDAEAELKAPPAFAMKAPVVCYGSSVLQGTGSKHPGKTYPAAMARRLNLDFVNLGFGGAGKAEAEVVALVNQPEACCYIFDLGKSYGAPTVERFARMLDTVRASHPKAPIFCVTPIYSTKEAREPDYLKKSEDLRKMMRQAAVTRRQAGDKLMFVVEGLELFGEKDKELFNDPLHPNDEGNELMGQRLAPMVEKVLLGKKE